jgi:hypothetical protein
MSQNGARLGTKLDAEVDQEQLKMAMYENT